jgi:dTDP-4-dehydrorhamnose 3,5-epimerase
MKIVETSLPGVLLFELDVHGDERGQFVELFNRARNEALGLPVQFVQDNVSRSRQGVVRGLHFQEPQPQGKLIQVLRGRIFEVAVDVRRGSSHFGRWVGVEMASEQNLQIWIPPGFAHGFCALTDADVFYKCTSPYAPALERCVRWDDPRVGVAWPVRDPILSAKDRAAPSLDEQRILPP